MEITGRITKVYDIQHGTGKYGPWKRKDVLIEQYTRFKTTLCVCIWEERLMNHALSVGSSMTFEIELSSRIFNSKWFTQANVKGIIPQVSRRSVKFETVIKKPERKSPVSKQSEWDDDFQADEGYSREELDDMYKAAFENNAQWEWNID